MPISRSNMFKKPTFRGACVTQRKTINANQTTQMTYFEAFFALLFHGLPLALAAWSCIAPPGQSQPQNRRLPRIEVKSKNPKTIALPLIIPS